LAEESPLLLPFLIFFFKYHNDLVIFYGIASISITTQLSCLSVTNKLTDINIWSELSLTLL